MRRLALWVPVGLAAVLVLGLWGVWTWRLGGANQQLSLAVEADRQRSFDDLAHHVEQIQALLGKGLVSGTTRQNMRYMADVSHHSLSAVDKFTSLPLPAELSAGVGKFLKQTGDFASSIMLNEAAGRELDESGRAELARLRQQAVNMSAQLQQIDINHHQGGFRWSPPVRFSWAALTRGAGLPPRSDRDPTGDTGEQAAANLAPGGWDTVGAAMGQLPTMLYDGPFSDHLGQRSAAVSGPPIAREEAERIVRRYVPHMQTYGIAEVVEVGGQVPGYSFRLTPGAAGAGQPAGATYTAVADIARNGGYLVTFLNGRTPGKAAINLDRARDLAREYLETHGYTGMAPTYGQVQDGIATLAFAFRENGVLIYPDQIKVNVALDNGDVVGVDARQFLMAHHARTLAPPKVSVEQAQNSVRTDLQIHRSQLALIPNLSGSGEILTYEFLGTFGADTFLVYVNANTGEEEQVLQQVQTDGGTFAL